MFTRLAIASVVAISSASAFAANNARDISRARIDFKVNGAKPVLRPPNTIAGVHSAGMRWRNRAQCSGFDLDVTLNNNFSKQEFERLMETGVSSFLGAIDPVNLAGAILKRTNPDLYEMISNGVLKASKMYDQSLVKCEAMQEMMLDQVPQSWADKASYQEEIQTWVDDGLDIAEQFRQGVTGSEGVEIGVDASGNKVFAGGAGQPPLNVMERVAHAGINSARAKDELDTSPITPSERANSYLLEIFPTPDDALEYLETVVGNVKLRTCSDCEKYEGSAPKGLQFLAIQRRDEIWEKWLLIEPLPLSNITQDQLDEFSVAGVSMLDRRMIRTLREMTPRQAGGYVDALVNELAFSQEVEKALAARQVLIMGLGTSKIGEQAEIRSRVHEALALLLEEIAVVEQEIQIRQQISGRVGDALMQREMLMRRTDRSNFNNANQFNDVNTP